jgi:hypothetical protein
VPVVPGERKPEVLPGDPASVGRAEVVHRDTAATGARRCRRRCQNDRDEERCRPHEVGRRYGSRGDRRGDRVSGPPGRSPRRCRPS